MSQKRITLSKWWTVGLVVIVIALAVNLWSIMLNDNVTTTFEVIRRMLPSVIISIVFVINFVSKMKKVGK